MASCQVKHLNSTTRLGCRRTPLGTHKNQTTSAITTLLFKETRYLKSLTLCICFNSSQGQQPRKPEKLKVSVLLRNNVNLRQELQEFISEVGLPSDKVPSFKELSFHGRQDLANIVRRRGYKAIAQLLTEPEGILTTESAENKTTHRDVAVRLKEFKEPNSSSLVQSSNVPPHDNSGSTDGPGYFQEQNSNLHIQYSQNTWSSGEDDSEEREGDEETDKNACKAYKRDDALLLTPYGMDAGKSSDGPSESDSSVPSISGMSVVTKAAYESYFWSDYPLMSDTIATKKTSFSTSEVQPFSREEASNISHRNISDQLHFNDDGIPKAIRSAGTKHMLLEVQHFNSVLHSKELEISDLKRELEKEKAKLYSIQAKAMAEVAREKQILSEKESELHAADQAHSDLKQVGIEYWGEGINVEVTGSFNGWQHHISMEPDLASEIQISKGTRGPLMWSTELWLYPGIYEIKFIVDGNWQVDPRREVVIRDMFENNVLKVEH